MNRCLITYQPIESGDYSKEGLRMLNPNLSNLQPLPFTRQTLLQEVGLRATQMSIAGAQPKASAILSVKDERFELVGHGGMYILKPPVEHFASLPENEDVSMKIATAAGLEVPLHGLVRAKDGSLVYWIKRFDRHGNAGKLPVEDFAQLTGQSRYTKYDWSMERLVPVLNNFCTFPMIERLKFFRLTLFCWIIGNEDMHLKNFSLITRNGKVVLSPVYDMVNSVIVLRSNNELALSLKGRNRKLKRDEWTKYWGEQRLELNERVINSVLDEFEQAIPEWLALLEQCFLPEEMKDSYEAVLKDRLHRLGIG